MPDNTPGVHARFYTEAVLNEVRSATEGRPCYDDVEMVEIIMAGQANLTRPVQRVNDLHRQRWPDQYAQFKAGLEQAKNGTPLETWPQLTRAMVEELKAQKIYTVEDCAALSDLACQRVGMGGYSLRERAKAYLDEAEELAQNARLHAMNEQLQANKSQQDKKIEELTALCDQLFNEVQALRGMQNPLAATAPMTHDPIERAKSFEAQPQTGTSPLAALETAPVVRRRGRPPKSAAA